MVAVVQVENALKTKNARDFVIVALVSQNVVADGSGRSQTRRITHIVIGGAHQVAGVSLLNELGDRAGSHEGNVIRMGLHREQDLSLVRVPTRRSLQKRRSMRFLS